LFGLPNRRLRKLGKAVDRFVGRVFNKMFLCQEYKVLFGKYLI